MLWRCHETPFRAAESRRERGEIAGCQHDDAARPQVALAQRERRSRVGEMLNYVEQRDDIENPESLQRGLVGNTGQDVQAIGTAVRRGILSQLNPGNLEV